MIKNALRIVSFCVAVFITVLVFQQTSFQEKSAPFDANLSFEMKLSAESTQASGKTKETIAEELDQLAAESNVLITHVIADPADYEHKRDIIWFGKKPPELKNPFVKGGEVKWLDTSMSGKFISATEIGSRSLDGSYYLNGSEKMKDALSNWAEENSIRVDWEPIKKLSDLNHYFMTVLFTGVGSALLASGVLLAAASTCFFAQQSRSRSLRLVAGLPSWKIHLQDLAKYTAVWLPAFILGAAASGVFIVVNSDFYQYQVLIKDIAFLGARTVTGILILSLLLTLLAAPTIKLLSHRELSGRTLNKVGQAISALVIVVSILVVPYAGQIGSAAYRMEKQSASWVALKNSVALAMKDYEEILTSTDYAKKYERFFDLAQGNGYMRLSMVIDESILYTADDLSPYDHFVMVDNSWLNSLGKDINDSSLFKEIDRSELKCGYCENLTNVSDGQVSSWLKNPMEDASKIHYFEYLGNDELLVLGQHVPFGGEIVKAKNPLVVYTEKPAATYNADFLASCISQETVIFDDLAQLKADLETAGLSSDVLAIDGIADTILDQAQKFKQEAFLYIAAVVLSVSAALLASFQNALLWAGANEKRIFCMHSAGINYPRIYSSRFRQELFLLIPALLIGAALCFLVKQVELPIIAVSTLAIAAIYLAGASLSLRRCSNLAFTRVAQRKS